MKDIKKKFTRASPADFSQKIGVPQGWFVISYRLVPDKKTRRLNHGKWFKIQSPQGHVYRILRFSVRLTGTPESDIGSIVLDWSALLKLTDYAEKPEEQDLDLTISNVRWWQYPLMAFAHPDPTHKLAGELGLLSVALGALSIAIALCL